MYLMLQVDKPDTFVLATGETVTVRDFVASAFKVTDIDVEWRGQAEIEEGYNTKTGELLVRVNPKFYRPAEVELLIGDPTKAKTVLGWKPKTGYKELAEIMVNSDIKNMGKL